MSSSKKRHHQHRRTRPVGASTKLKKAMKRRMVGLDASRAVAWQLIELLAKVNGIYDYIDAAYAGHLFLPSMPPEAPLNRIRFNTYIDNSMRAMKLHWRAIELWMLVFGMKKEDNWTPL